jgi:hypothetical protein
VVRFSDFQGARLCPTRQTGSADSERAGGCGGLNFPPAVPLLASP